MEALAVLKQQHKEVLDLIERFEAAKENEQIQQEVFVRIADNIAAHARVEEQLFYPSVYVGPTAEQLRVALEEHLAVKRVIADLLDLEPTDEAFLAKMKVLKDLFLHHVEEEEQTLFPGVKGMLAREELEAMGEEIERQFAELLQTEPRRQLPQETEAAPPLA